MKLKNVFVIVGCLGVPIDLYLQYLLDYQLPVARVLGVYLSLCVNSKEVTKFDKKEFLEEIVRQTDFSLSQIKRAYQELLDDKILTEYKVKDIFPEYKGESSIVEWNLGIPLLFLP